jgi:hypothetical protein
MTADLFRCVSAFVDHALKVFRPQIELVLFARFIDENENRIAITGRLPASLIGEVSRRWPWHEIPLVLPGRLGGGDTPRAAARGAGVQAKAFLPG